MRLLRVLYAAYPHKTASSARLHTSAACSHTNRYDAQEAGAAADELDSQTSSLLADQFSAAHHKVALLEPYFCGRLRLRRVRSLSSAVLRQQEACALVASVPGWYVVHTADATVRSVGSAALFTSGVLQRLTEELPGKAHVDTVFVNLAQLSGCQVATLSAAWRRPVLDRYTLVLLIFWARAHSHEARLQVALAELPLLRSRLLDPVPAGTGSALSGARPAGARAQSGDSLEQIQARFLDERANVLRKQLHRVEEQRAATRRSRRRGARADGDGLPSVAMVGYTNAGKTSLISALSGGGGAAPQDRLFATLDASCHAARLPHSGMHMLLVDTVGFIQELPTALVASFRATLADTLAADLLLHVVDLSSEDAPAQTAQVRTTLDHLLRGESTYAEGVAAGRIIEVGNKADLASAATLCEFLAASPARLALACRPRGDTPVLDDGALQRRVGMAALQERLSGVLVAHCGYRRHRIAVAMGSALEAWLRRHAVAVQAEQEHPSDARKVVLTLLLTEACLARMRAHFPPR